MKPQRPRAMAERIAAGDGVPVSLGTAPAPDRPAAGSSGPRTRRHSWVAQILAVGVLAGGGTTAVTPAWADTPPHAAAAVTADDPADQLTAITAAAADAARAQVLRLAKSALPAEIRTSAWNALRSTRGDAAIAEWLAPGGGYDAVKQRLRDTRARNRAFCERVVLTHPVSFSPEVRAAAQRALSGTDADRTAFVSTGYTEAQQRDRAVREADEEHRLEIAEQDREFVLAIVGQDTGEHVRAAAQWAVRSGATDADIAEFFGFGWADGASLDLEAYRLRVSDAEVRQHHLLTRLVQQAVAAERALETAADTAKARAEAERSWKEVADHAGAARSSWLVEQEAALAQAERWRYIAQVAEEGVGTIWQNISAPAETHQNDWAGEQAAAGATAEFWSDMLDQAREGEIRVKG